MILLDTSGIFSYHHAAEPQHGQARTLFRTSGRKLIHSYVLAEFIALAHARKAPRVPALAFAASLLDHPQVEVV